MITVKVRVYIEITLIPLSTEKERGGGESRGLKKQEVLPQSTAE